MEKKNTQKNLTQILLISCGENNKRDFILLVILCLAPTAPSFESIQPFPLFFQSFKLCLLKLFVFRQAPATGRFHILVK